MTEMTPESLRAEAARQGQLANEAVRRSDKRAAERHIERARELTVLALKLERESGTD